MKISESALVKFINIRTCAFVGFLIGGGVLILFGAPPDQSRFTQQERHGGRGPKEFDVPGVREGKVMPDYRKAVGISTLAAQRKCCPWASWSC